jgi:uncharacterized membrane protein
MKTKHTNKQGTKKTILEEDYFYRRKLYVALLPFIILISGGIGAIIFINTIEMNFFLYLGLFLLANVACVAGIVFVIITIVNHAEKQWKEEKMSERIKEETTSTDVKRFYIIYTVASVGIFLFAIATGEEKYINNDFFYIIFLAGFGLIWIYDKIRNKEK